MAVTSTKGLKVWLEKAGVTPTSVVPTAISKAKPAEITGPTAGLADTEICEVTGTDYPEIDNKLFVLDGITTGGGAGVATSFTLLGSNTTASAATTIGGTPAIKVYAQANIYHIACSINFYSWCASNSGCR